MSVVQPRVLQIDSGDSGRSVGLDAQIDVEQRAATLL